jgi:hypothetical protein
MMNLNQSITWQEICNNSSLQNLPFKIESNQQGQLLMTPVKVYHSLFQGKIIAPEICIEVMSSGNTEEEMLGKRKLYCENGAEEFWICDQKGQFRFFSPDEELAHSLLLSEFPRTIR